MVPSIKSSDWQTKFFLLGLILTTLAISPWTSFDPFNSPKFVSISILAFGIAAVLIYKISLNQFFEKYKYLCILLTLFLLQSLFVIFSTNTPTLLQFTGADGRNTGFISYVSLIILLIFTCYKSTPKFMKDLIIVLLVTGLINALYGILQYFNLDPFEWTNPYNPVFGFFGNPNFQSAFMGIASSAAWAIIFLKKNNVIRLIIILYLSLTLFVIFVSDSLQGVIVYLTGFLISTFILIAKSKNYMKYTKYFGISIFIIGFITILDILQLTPWNSFLYKDSVSNRGDLWRAGWRMGIDNPVSGVGFDGYGYYYRQYRDQLAIAERGAEISSNSAHNVFLDMLTNGGFPLLIIYILLLALVLISAISGIRKSTDYNPIFTALVASWASYQVQSLISINQLGIAIWGWVLGGAIIGYERIIINQQLDKFIDKRNNKFNSISLFLFGISFGLIVSTPTYFADTNFRTAIDSKRIELVLESAYKWPQSPERMFQVAEIFRKNNILDLSAQVAKDSVNKFPMDYKNWELISTLPNLSESERNNALKYLQELDPNNLNLGK